MPKANINRVQAVTHERLRRYNTTPDHCNCKDFELGGSYSSPDHRDCKHTVKLAAEMHHFGTKKWGSRWTCGCVEWRESDGEGLEGSCVHTQAAQGWKKTEGRLAHV